MTNNTYDVAILGAGPGGYPAAIRLAQGKKKVALIENSFVGGTCLNRGCIPTKAYLAHSEMLTKIKQAKKFNIEVSSFSFDFAKIAKDKTATVENLRRNLENTIKSWGIELIAGTGTLLDAHRIQVQERTITAKNIIIATGSEPKELPGVPFDGIRIHSSTSILNVEKAPQSMVIIGGGAIGCEFASIFHEFGTKITIVEALERILPLECEHISQALSSSFSSRGMTLHTGAFVEKIEKTSSGVIVKLKGKDPLIAECCLIAIGRAINSTHIGLEKVGIITQKGAIQVNDYLETNIPGIYAIGDVTGKAMYAHLATHQGLVAADHILGTKTRMHYNAVPGAVFTYPQVASVGLSLKEARIKNPQAKRVTYPYQGLGKAWADKEPYGFAAIVFEESTGAILGAQIIGENASDLIATMTTAIANELTIESIAPETIHAHPTLQELWAECAFIAQKRPLHFPKMSV